MRTSWVSGHWVGQAAYSDLMPTVQVQLLSYNMFERRTKYGIRVGMHVKEVVELHTHMSCVRT